MPANKAKPVTFRTKYGKYSFVLRTSKKANFNHKGILLNFAGDARVNFNEQGMFITSDPKLAAAIRKHKLMNVDFFEDKGMSPLPKNTAPKPSYKIPFNAVKAMNKSELIDFCNAHGIKYDGELGAGETKETLLQKIKTAMHPEEATEDTKEEEVADEESTEDSADETDDSEEDEEEDSEVVEIESEQPEDDEEEDGEDEDEESDDEPEDEEDK